jgi:hypothetical protein
MNSGANLRLRCCFEKDRGRSTPVDVRVQIVDRLEIAGKSLLRRALSRTEASFFTSDFDASDPRSV